MSPALETSRTLPLFDVSVLNEIRSPPRPPFSSKVLAVAPPTLPSCVSVLRGILTSPTSTNPKLLFFSISSIASKSS